MKRVIVIVFCALLALSQTWASGSKETGATAAPPTITVWDELAECVAQVNTNVGDTPLYKELEKRTGIHVTWIHPAAGQASEQFTLLIASNQLPDMMYRTWTDYPGGPEKAISDKVITRLNELVKDNAPNLTRRLSQLPDIAKAVKTDSGTMYCFPYAQSDPGLLVWMGPVLRKDWLTALNVTPPGTIAEWYQVLKALKTKCDYPITFTGPGKSIRDVKYTGAFIGAYGIRQDWYVDGGKVKFGAYESAYRDFLTLFAKWYGEGLIDPDFVTNDTAALDAKVLSGKAGSFVGAGGSNVGKYMNAMKTSDPTFDLVGTTYPVLNKGDVPFTGQTDLPFRGDGNAITTKAKDPALCTKWSDYAYGDQGYMLFNFGIEGVSYTMTNGYPKYTDLVLNNPNMGVDVALGQYTRAVYNGSMLVDLRYLEQYYKLPQQQEAWKKWGQTKALEHSLPAVTPSQQESEELSTITSEIDTYVDEMFVKFVTGQEPLDSFEKYRAQLKALGIERAIAIQQAAYGRYAAR